MSLSSRPDTMLFTLIEQFEELYMCAGPSCLPIAKCQRCRLLRYCSTDCQLEGWNWQQSPHKITCKMIPRFTAILGNVNETHGHIDNVSERIYRAVEDAGVSWHDGDLVATALSKLIFLREAIERT
ncbi:hypothetical protein BKA62DRAFT_721746 [Auriculariales sp. MPI-PUGE-AT-0066]|nr:hypothetical protein BKA62DRAFT_721746 [Auriculariales sp. MPI-PUGE-AT-0066]